MKGVRRNGGPVGGTGDSLESHPPVLALPLDKGVRHSPVVIRGCRFSVGIVSGVLGRQAACRLAFHEASHRLRVAHTELLVEACRISPIRK